MEWRISIHRKILEREWYSDLNTKSTFLHCLLKANIQDKKRMWIDIERWSYISSIWKEAIEIWITRKQLLLSLSKLEKSWEITTKRDNKKTTFIVVKYCEYQSVEWRKVHQRDIKGTSKVHQRDTTKEVKNTKEEIGEISLLDKTIKEFSNMRSKIKKPLTPKANSMLINKLTKLGNSDSEKVMLLEQSIFHCRQDIYPLKDEYKLDNPKIFRKYLNEWKTDYLKEMMGVDKFMEIKKQLLSN